ncbi:MAG: OB-fold domain-containing protein [Bdellovibrionota bacterium]
MSARAIMGTSAVAAPFWEATKNKKLLLQWCARCERPIHYPREFCPHCLSTELSWRESAGHGTVYAVSVMHKPGNPMMAVRVPYAVVLVDLDDGVRLLSNVAGCKPEDVRVGMKVRVAWEELPEGRHLPVFEPAV